MADYTSFLRRNLHRLAPTEPFLPLDNPTFGNPPFQDASFRVLIARLSPFRDVARSFSHLFLFHETRRTLPEAFIDLAFFPAAETRALFSQEGIPFLLGVHSLRSADEFDLLLISNAYALELINLPYLLLRSGIPLLASQRGPDQPLILLGGSNALAAQAIIREDGDSMADGLFFGEGEGAVGAIAAALASRPRAERRRALAEAAGRIPGLWAAGSPRQTVKAICAPDADSVPVHYPILNSPEANTAHLPIAYGCPAFCSFCFEGYDRKPYREVARNDLLAAARRIKQAQGVEELNLYSFNFNTHQDILALILELHRLFDRVGLKSQRADILQRTPALLEAEVEADKRSFTLGVEGVSDRMRAFLHKSLPTDDITGLLARLLALPIREIKLFYILTGHETEADLDEFRQFARWLKETRRARNPGIRVIFSLGLTIRQPRTPLQYDRLFLDEAEWKPLIGPVKSACETNGFEFRLAFDWPAYCVSQALALGGHWLIEPLTALAQEGYCFDKTLPVEYWEKLKGWMKRTGRWNEAFLGEKGPSYPFALDFVGGTAPEFLYAQYQEARAGRDAGYCLGKGEQAGVCLGCGACQSAEQRQAITRHSIRQPDAGDYLALLRETMTRKRRLKPVYYRVRLESRLAGAAPEFLNAFVFKSLLARYPEWTDNVLTVRESLFTVRPNDRRFPIFSGETVFAIRAWDVEEMSRALAKGDEAFPGFEILGPAEGFTPGQYARLRLEIRLPADVFPEPRRRLEAYLRGAHLPYSLRREGNGYRFDLPTKALKKKILFAGFIETQEEGFFASLDVGPKFDPGELLRTFGHSNLARQAQIRVLHLEW